MKKSILLAMLILAVVPSLPVAAEDNVLPQWALGGFRRPEGVNPLISPTSATAFRCPVKKTAVKWECADTFNPAAVVRDGKVVVLYRAEDDPSAGIGGRTSRIGYAESDDGTHVTRRLTEPVMYPDESEVSQTYEWPGGVEDPRVVEAEVDGAPLYVMTHTSWNKNTARLSVATSRDLKTWTHHGPAFRTAYGGKFLGLACKSGSIVTEIKDGRLQAAKVKVDGEYKYFMYWGEEWVCGAVSDDLINWEPVVDSDLNLRYLARPRNGYFDSQLTECGPPAVLTADGIVLVYNGKNKSGSNGDPCYPANTYAAGQMLFSADDPLQLTDRLDKPFFRPMKDFEKSGQYAAGTVFVEGLVYHADRWLLYYGCADSFVGVAVCDESSAKTGDPVLIDTVPAGVVNQQTGLSSGKARCRIQSYSGMVNEDESPRNLLTSYVSPGRKWCDTSTETPWVVMEFTGIYSINRMVMRDVGNREDNCGNVPEYWLYTKVNASDAWELAAHETDVDTLAEKDITFPQREARYVKLQVRRGVRPSGVADNAVRIYGCDIYGEFLRLVERTDGAVSVGKTVLTSYDTPDAACSAMNLLTGNPSADSPWKFTQGVPSDSPMRYVVVDLESVFDIRKFMIWDARSLDSDASNIGDYRIYVSEERPDLSLMGKNGDDNTCWTLVATRKNTVSSNKKTVVLSSPVRGRYVKLLVPRTNTGMNTAASPKLYALYVYGQEVDTDGITATAAEERESDRSYDMLGRPVGNGYKGVAVKADGRKVLRR